MIFGTKKYSKSGRLRFGSTILVDDLKEELVDTISSYKRSKSMIFIGFSFVILKLFTGNGLGLILGSTLFLFMYLFEKSMVYFQITKYRMLILKEYAYPRLIRFFAYVFLAISAQCILRLFYPLDVIDKDANLSLIVFMMQWMHVLPVLQVQYQTYITENYSFLYMFDSILTGLIYLFFGTLFYNMKYEFEEIHLSQIHEELVDLKRENSSNRIIIFVFSLIITMQIIFKEFNLLYMMFLLVIYRYVPRKVVAEFSLKSGSGVNLVRKHILHQNEFSRFSNLTATIFGWNYQSDNKNKFFPQNIIPEDSASFYETGLRASLLDSFSQANKIGLVVSTGINSLVVASLIRFAIRNHLNRYLVIFGIAIGLVIISASIFQILALLGSIQYTVQPEEILMIGNSFIARYIEPKMWIMRGENLRGSRYQTAQRDKVVQYSQAHGLVIHWQRLTIYLGFFVGAIIVIAWSSIGGLNFNNAIYILPFIVNVSFAFILEKAARELGFFILLGYVFWIAFYFNYYRIYGSFRPQISLDLPNQDSIQIILKNYEDQQNASVQLTKCLINTSRSPRRFSEGRPGTFILEIGLVSNTSDHDIILEFGMQRFHFLIKRGMVNPLLIESLAVSGEIGVPQLQIILRELDQESVLNYDLRKTGETKINVGSSLIVAVKVLQELN